MKIVYQGHQGAYSHMATQALFPNEEHVCASNFAKAFDVLEEGGADLAVIPVENSTAGRVADVHLLMNRTSIHIVGEYFLPIQHCLLGVKGASIADVKEAYSHVQALAQCEKHLNENSINARQYSDTAGAAKMVSETNDKTKAAVASKMAAEIYGLDVLSEDFQDTSHNTTRFLVLSLKPEVPASKGKCITTAIFRTRNLPAALYKALGGFATNGVNLLKIESYLEGGSFSAAAFYIDFEGHTDNQNVRNALEELEFFSDEVRVLGCYSAHKHREMY